LLALLLLFLGYTGFGRSALWPNIIFPPAISIREAARAALKSMGFTLVRCAFRHPPSSLAYTRDVLLRIPRKGESRRGVSLMDRAPIRRRAAMASEGSAGLFLIWTASVPLALGVYRGPFSEW